MSTKTLKVKQVSAVYDGNEKSIYVFAVADDGSVWWQNQRDGEWNEMSPIDVEENATGESED